MMIRSFLGIGALGALSLVACSEAAPVGGADAATRPDALTPSGDDAFAPPAMVDAFVTPGLVPPTPTGVGLVINELVPDGDPDFVELYNAGSTPVALDGYIFADADGIATPPDPTHRTTLPAGVTVAPGAYLVVAMNIDPPLGMTETPVGPVMPCPVAGVASCLQTSYGIGRTGDTIVLLEPDGTTELARVEYSGDLMGPAASHCRLPDGIGPFATCTSTPGAANAM